MQKILIVEDEIMISNLLKLSLEEAGYETESIDDGNNAYNKIIKDKPNCVILDLILPNINGFDVCKQLRQENNKTPIIMLTAKDDEINKIMGLEIGADDYITKPFSPREVVARVKAVLRRYEVKNSDTVSDNVKIFDKIKFYPERYEVYNDDKKLELTLKEFELLQYLINNLNKVVTRDELLSNVWKYSFAGDTRIIDIHISHLREKLEDDSKNPTYIKTVRGIGYKFQY